jgi:hypothetical protein
MPTQSRRSPGSMGSCIVRETLLCLSAVLLAVLHGESNAALRARGILSEPRSIRPLWPQSVTDSQTDGMYIRRYPTVRMSKVIQIDKLAWMWRCGEVTMWRWNDEVSNDGTILCRGKVLGQRPIRNEPSSSRGSHISPFSRMPCIIELGTPLSTRSWPGGLAATPHPKICTCVCHFLVVLALT